VRRYGWVADRADHRDRLYALPPHGLALPSSVDLTPLMPPIYDQGAIGSCTANAIAAALQFERAKHRLPDFVPSRLFVYWNERALEGTTDYDSGAAIRDGIKSVASQGDLPETSWPYDPDLLLTQPPQRCYDAALFYSAVTYQRVGQDIDAMRVCLAGGNPIVLGFTVHQAFEGDEVARTGEVQMPVPGEAALGGHAVLCIGYDDAAQRFRLRNSWGEGWGQAGYFRMPYAYLIDPALASDFWCIEVTP
jgi:C1A family cysteine protease